MQVKNLPLPVLSHRLKTSCCVAKAEPSSSLNMTITFFTLYDTTIHRVIEIDYSFTPGSFSQLSDTYPIFFEFVTFAKGKVTAYLWKLELPDYITNVDVRNEGNKLLGSLSTSSCSNSSLPSRNSPKRTSRPSNA